MKTIRNSTGFGPKGANGLPELKKKKPHGLIGSKRPQEVKDKISAAQKGKPKNYDVWLKGLSGKAHPAYKHGLGYENREYDSENTQAWIYGVKRAHNFKCFITGSELNLECHHLIGYAHLPTRFCINNGVLISAQIHKDFHNEYGRGGNLPEQFEEFCQNRYNITGFPWRQGNHNPSLEVLKANLKTGTDKRGTEFEQLVKSRGHEIVSGSFTNNSSMFTINCPIHKNSSEVKVQRYKNAAFGLNCCARAKQSSAVTKANRLRVNKPVTKSTSTAGVCKFH